MPRLEAMSCEANVVSHCNLRCRYCDQWSPFWASEVMPLGVLERDLARLAESLVVEEFRILGGEPLLHPALAEVVAVVRASGLARQVSIITNGVLLDRMDAAIWQGIDRLRISLYPGVRQRMTLEAIGEQATEFGVEVLVQDHIRHPFRLTGINRRNEDRGLVAAIHRGCADRLSCNTIHHGRFFCCTQATYFGRRTATLGVDAFAPPEDHVAIHEVDDLRGALQRYLTRERPLEACAFCLGSFGRSVPADQGDRPALAARLAEDHGNPRALLAPQVAHALACEANRDGTAS